MELLFLSDTVLHKINSFVLHRIIILSDAIQHKIILLDVVLHKIIGLTI